MAELTLVEAVNDALHVELARDPTVMVMGEDVGRAGGVFRATAGLLDAGTIEQIRAEAAELMREGIAAAEAEPPADPELVFAHAYAEPPPGLRDG